MEGSEFGHQVGGVLCGVDCQSFRNDEQRASKLSNSQLLTGTLGQTHNSLNCAFFIISVH